jgi:L-threonylcarbamoyladenylate synthase
MLAQETTSTRILHESIDAYRAVADVLAAGGLVAIPGVSNYSVIVNAEDDEAVRRLYRVKRRPASKPITLMVPPQDVASWVEVDDACRSALCLLGEPIVLVGRARRGTRLSPYVNDGSIRLGVFWLNTRLHKLLYALTARSAAFPIAGTSLNLSGQPMVTRASVAVRQFGGLVDAIVDGGDCVSAGAQATVLDVSTPTPVLLREGYVGEDTIRALLPSLVVSPAEVVIGEV